MLLAGSRSIPALGGTFLDERCQKSMKRISLQFIIAILTFIVGVVAVAFWFAFRTAPLGKQEDVSCCSLNFAASIPKSQPAENSYFAAGTFQPDEAREKGLAKWYSRSLQEMDEPSFQSLVPANIEIYRFLWLRSFHPPISIRVWKCERDYCVSVKQLDSIDRYIDGKFISSARLAVNRTRPLNSDEWSGFLSLVEKARFWSLPTVDGEPLANDGAAWVLEGAKEKKYHVVDRQSPQNGEYREACVYLLKLSGLKVDEAKGELY
jgi:hypothetical protein